MQSIKTVLSLSHVLTRRLFRDKTALFFTFIFPLIFLLVFGSLFRNGEANFNVAIFNYSTTPLAQGFEDELRKIGSVHVKQVDSIEAAKEMMGRGELESIVEVPASFGQSDEVGRAIGNVVVYFDEGSPQAGQAFAGIVQGIIGEFNRHLIHEFSPLDVTQRAAKTAGLEQFDYTLPGLIGFSILSLGIFGMTEGFAADKKNGALRRLRVAPIKVWQFIMATALNRVFVGLLVTATMFLAAITLFSFEMRGNYLYFVLFTIVSTVCLFGFGIAIAGWAKDGNQAAPVANLISFPMMFLSGVFFPRFLMPEWLQSVTVFIPLTPIVDGLRFILTEGKSLFELGPQVAVIAGWTIIIYTIAFKVFDWE